MLETIPVGILQEGIAIGEQRGIVIGEQRGIAIGEQRGIAIGEQRGEPMGEIRTALRLRFHSLPSDFSERLRAIKDVPTLTKLAEFAFVCNSLEEFSEAMNTAQENLQNE